MPGCTWAGSARATSRSGSDGQLTTWQLFNTLRDGQVPFHFLVRRGHDHAAAPNRRRARLAAGQADRDDGRIPGGRAAVPGSRPAGPARADGVQLRSRRWIPGFPRCRWRRSCSGSTTPPSRSRRSRWPALMQNPVGYDAAGPNRRVRTNPNFGGNVNEVLQRRRRGGTGSCGPSPAAIRRMDEPRDASRRCANLRRWTRRRPTGPKNLRVEVLEPAADARTEAGRSGAHGDLARGGAGRSVRGAGCSAAQAAVQAGATLLFSGRTHAAAEELRRVDRRQAAAAEAAGRPDIVFEDFEHGYENWKVEGTAFGQGAGHGHVAESAARVAAFWARAWSTRYLGGDDTTGRLISQPFTIERHFIRFLVGGGASPPRRSGWWWTARSCARPRGKRQRAAPARPRGTWASSRARRRTSRSWTQQQGAWGHINVDQIEFSDMPGDQAVMAAARGVAAGAVQRVVVQRAPTRRGAQRRSSWRTSCCSRRRPGPGSSAASPLLPRPVGKGKVVLAPGPMLEPAQAGISRPRQPAFAFLCELVGANYTGAGRGQHPKAPGFGTLALAALGRRCHRPAGLRRLERGLAGIRGGRPLSRRSTSAAPEPAHARGPDRQRRRGGHA